MIEISREEFLKSPKYKLVIGKTQSFSDIIYYPEHSTSKVIPLKKSWHIDRKTVSVRYFKLTDDEVCTMILPRII